MARLLLALLLICVSVGALADWFNLDGTPKVAAIAAVTITGTHVVGQIDVTAPAVVGTASVTAPAVIGTATVAAPSVTGTSSVVSPIGNLTTVNSTTVNAGTVNTTTLSSTTLHGTTVTGTDVVGTATVSAPAVSGTTVTGTDVVGTTVTGTELQLDTGTKTASASGGAATLNKNSGVITTEPLFTVAGGQYVLTVSDSVVLSGDEAFVSLRSGTNTGGTPVVVDVTPSAGQLVIVVKNIDLANALNGTLVITFMRLRA